jgi:hypothetical protein
VYYTVISNTSVRRLALTTAEQLSTIGTQLQAMQAQINGLGSLSGASSRLLFQGQSSVILTGTSTIVIADP